MNLYRMNATIVGVLFIIERAAGVLSVVFTNSIFTAPDYLGQVSANENRIILRALCVLVMGFALVIVPVLLMNLLIFFQEMVMAVWLIARGFNQKAVTP